MVFVVLRVRDKTPLGRLKSLSNVKQHFYAAYLRSAGFVVARPPKAWIDDKKRAFVLLEFYEIFPFNLPLLRSFLRLFLGGLGALACSLKFKKAVFLATTAHAIKRLLEENKDDGGAL